jgi:predicted secreted acid phosphatase
VLLGAILATAAIGVAAKSKKPAKRDPDPAISVRPTGVGLPVVGAHGTLGIGEFTQSVRNYANSGQYSSDLADIGAHAQRFVTKQANTIRRKCPKKKKCKPVPKLAIVMDIDETALLHYDDLQSNDFTDASDALVTATLSADSPANGPMGALYDLARSKGISVFFITGRPPLVRPLTERNLKNVGYEDPQIFYKPEGAATIPFKSGQRAALEADGYRIIANIGDQESDLAGGHADRAFKVPNPFYFIE